MSGLMQWDKECVDLWLTVTADCLSPGVRTDCNKCVYDKECQRLHEKFGLRETKRPCFFCDFYQADCYKCSGTFLGCIAIKTPSMVDRAISKIEDRGILDEIG